MQEKEKKSRRKFLSLGLLGAAGLVTGTARADVPAEGAEKVKMLTADGKLVEVDKSVLDAAANRQKASNKDILHWINREGEV